MQITLQAEFGDLVEISQVIEVATLINIAEAGQSGGGGGDWADITGKPSTFPPSAHTHNKSAVGLGNVDNTSDANKPVSAATQAALDAKQDAIAAGTSSQYYRGDKTFQTLDKSAVGLGNVDNASDANKPVSTATQTALDAKQDTITAGTSSQYYRGDKTFQTLDKTAVGLGNVNNTSDANKPVSTATQTALDAKQDTIAAGTSSQYYRGDKTFQTLDKSAVGLGNADNTSDANKPISTATQAALDAKQPTGSYLTGNQTITFSGDATGSGTTSVTLTIANNAVTLAKMATVATATFLGRTTAGTGNVEALTAAQATALLNTATSSAKGLAPATGTATNVKFLRDDMTYTASAQSWEAQQEKFVLYCDYFSDSTYTVANGWSLSGNSGTVSHDVTASDNAAAIGNRTGVSTITSGAGALTGYYAVVSSADLAMAPTTAVTIKASIYLNSASASNLRLRFGNGVSSNTADSTNQIACEITGRTFQGRCKNGGSSTATSSTYTLSSSTWYTIGMTIPNGGASITFFVLDGATGASLFSGTVSTNIPSSALRPVFSVANDSGGGVTKLITLDSLYYERNTMGRA